VDNKAHIISICCSENKIGGSITQSGIQKDRKLCDRYEFSPHLSPGEESNEIKKFVNEKMLSNILWCNTEMNKEAPGWTKTKLIL
jgi:hypothetical protein